MYFLIHNLHYPSDEKSYSRHYPYQNFFPSPYSFFSRTALMTVVFLLAFLLTAVRKYLLFVSFIKLHWPYLNPFYQRTKLCKILTWPPACPRPAVSQSSDVIHQSVPLEVIWELIFIHAAVPDGEGRDSLNVTRDEHSIWTALHARSRLKYRRFRIPSVINVSINQASAKHLLS